MVVNETGHVYLLTKLDTKISDEAYAELTFVCREKGCEHPGVTNQEVLRALIDRVQYLDKQLPWDGNEKILYHLRAALVLHEARVLERKAEEGKILPEKIAIDPKDGHYLLQNEP